MAQPPPGSTRTDTPLPYATLFRAAQGPEPAGQREVERDQGAGEEADVGPQQPEPAVYVADKGLHELIDDGQVVHGAGLRMVRRDAAEPGRGSKGRPSSAATAAIERAKARPGTRLRAAVFSGFAYWPRGLLWRVSSEVRR